MCIGGGRVVVERRARSTRVQQEGDGRQLAAGGAISSEAAPASSAVAVAAARLGPRLARPSITRASGCFAVTWLLGTRIGPVEVLSKHGCRRLSLPPAAHRPNEGGGQWAAAWQPVKRAPPPQYRPFRALAVLRCTHLPVPCQPVIPDCLSMEPITGQTAGQITAAKSRRARRAGLCSGELGAHEPSRCGL